MAQRAYLYGQQIVDECLKDEKVSVFLRQCIFEEIVPTTANRETDVGFYRPDKVNDGEEVMAFMSRESVEELMNMEDYWHADLMEMLPFVSGYYNLI